MNEQYKETKEYAPNQSSIDYIGVEKYLSIPWLDGSNTKMKKYL